jgi:hypothetical protein
VEDCTNGGCSKRVNVVKYIPIDQAAIEATCDNLLRDLVIQTVLALLVWIILAVGAFPAGTSPGAVAIRVAARDFMGNNKE